VIGKTLAHYEIVERIGAGGMGEVYRARDTRLGRDVAIKVLPEDAARDPERRRRFEAEARTVAALKHPNIVTIHSVETVDGVRFLTMELVEGTTLANAVPPGGMTLGPFLEIAMPLVDAVACAHAKGVTHRDLKPANIMRDADGRLKVLDFGLAKLWSESSDGPDTVAGGTKLTQTGAAVGTPAYMSPEQISGRGADARSDVFSLGILFHELLTGEHPFAAEYPAATMVRIVSDAAPSLSGPPEALTAIVARCLRKDPGERFPSAEELRRALQSFTESLASGETRRAVAEPLPTADPRVDAAMKTGAWAEAHRALQELAEERPLVAEELEMLGEVLVWLSRWDDSLESLERAHAMFAEQGRGIAAARVALTLHYFNLVMERSAIARGWLKRAERFLEDQPICPELGLLARHQLVHALADCDLDRAEELNRQCAEIARQTGDEDLRVVALHDRGQILVARGKVDEGSALVDEAMAAAVAGDAGLETVGVLFCRTLGVCRAVADLDRTLEWADAATRWSESHRTSSFPGICKVHSAEAFRHHGRWRDAERAAREACDHFERIGPASHAGEAFNELGELVLRKGDLREAEDAFRRAHEYGYDPVPGLPLLRLAQGRGEAALQLIDRALGECPENRLRRASLLSVRVIITLALARTDAAAADAEELSRIAEEFRCPGFRATAAMARGAVLLEGGDAAHAVPLLREAWSGFHRGGFAYDAARARALLARAYRGTGAEEDARMQLDAARKTFADLGARLDLATVEALIEPAS
jgi:serine/threonine protein kinase